MVQISQTVNLMDIYGRKTIAMKHFFAGIGEIYQIYFIIIALGMILALILVLSRVYRKYFYRDDDD